MRLCNWFAASILTLTVLFVAADVAAADHLLVTRYFTGLWDQTDQQNQGISLQIIEHPDGSRGATASWFTYGSDRKTAWFLGIGTPVEDRIEFDLYDSTDVGFMQNVIPGEDSVFVIGTMTISFDSCDSGLVTFETSYSEVGSGSFRIKRLTNMPNGHCSGGISDDMGAFAMYGEQQVDLSPAHGGINGSGRARYSDSPGRSEFQVEVTGLPDGNYHLFVGMMDRGVFTVHDGFGALEFHSPAESGMTLLTFDPRQMSMEIHDTSGAVLSSFDNMFDLDDHDQMDYGDDHVFDCNSGMGGGMGSRMGMVNCVQQGDVIKLRASLLNHGPIPAASGDAEWEMSSQHQEFYLEIEDVPVGSYVLMVGGKQVGTIVAVEMHGKAVGMIRFRDPEVFGMGQLDFDPRGQTIQVMSQDHIILEVNFPIE